MNRCKFVVLSLLFCVTAHSASLGPSALLLCTAAADIAERSFKASLSGTDLQSLLNDSGITDRGASRENRIMRAVALAAYEAPPETLVADVRAAAGAICVMYTPAQLRDQ